MSDFFSMGGYAHWVWGAFGLTVVVLVGNILAAGRRYHRAVELLRQRMDRTTRESGT